MVYIGSKRNADVCLYFKFLLNPRDASYFLRDNLIITDYLHTFFAVNKFTDNISFFACVLKALNSLFSLIRINSYYHTDTHIECVVHISFRNISLFLHKIKYRKNLP